MRFTQELYSELKEVLRSLCVKTSYIIGIYENKIVIERFTGLTIIYSSMNDKHKLNDNPFWDFSYKYDKYFKCKYDSNWSTKLPLNMNKVVPLFSRDNYWHPFDRNIGEKRFTPEQILQEIQGTWERPGFLQFTLNSDWIDIKFNY